MSASGLIFEFLFQQSTQQMDAQIRVNLRATNDASNRRFWNLAGYFGSSLHVDDNIAVKDDDLTIMRECRLAKKQAFLPRWRASSCQLRVIQWLLDNDQVVFVLSRIRFPTGLTILPPEVEVLLTECERDNRGFIHVFEVIQTRAERDCAGPKTPLGMIQRFR